jgi:hypothetical protein
MWGYRRELRAAELVILALVIPSLVGGITGTQMNRAEEFARALHQWRSCALIHLVDMIYWPDVLIIALSDILSGSSEADSQSNAELPLIDSLARRAGRVCDFRKSSQIPNGSVRIQIQIGNVSSRIREVRSVGEVEGFRAELYPPPLGGGKFPEDAEVPVRNTRPPHTVEAGGSEARLRHRGKGKRIEEGLASSHPAQLLHRGLHLVGSLAAARHVQRRARRRHREGRPFHETQDVVHLPAAQECGG